MLLILSPSFVFFVAGAAVQADVFFVVCVHVLVGDDGMLWVFFCFAVEILPTRC